MVATWFDEVKGYVWDDTVILSATFRPVLEVVITLVCPPLDKVNWLPLTAPVEEREAHPTLPPQLILLKLQVGLLNIEVPLAPVTIVGQVISPEAFIAPEVIAYPFVLKVVQLMAWHPIPFKAIDAPLKSNTL